MKILYNNLVPASSIDSLTEDPSAPFSTAFNDSRLSRTGKTLDDVTQWIRFDLGSAIATTDIAVMGSNFQSSASVVLKGNATDSWGSPTFSETLTLYDDIWYASYASSSLRYWRLEVDDSTNPDTVLKIGQVFLGAGLTMPAQELTPELPKNTTSVSAISESGQVYGTPRLDYKTAGFNFTGVIESEKTSIDAFFDSVRNIEPFVMIPWEDTTTTTGVVVEAPMYCVLSDAQLRWRKVSTRNGILWSLPMNFIEVF
jgi:hypothetical protein